MPYWGLVRTLFLVADDYLLIVPHMAEKRESIGSHLSSYKGTNPIMKPHPHDLTISQRLHSQVPLQWGLKFQDMNLEKIYSVHRNSPDQSI